MDEQMRKDFEAWCPDSTQKDKDGDYSQPFTRAYWRAWQACAAALSQPAAAEPGWIPIQKAVPECDMTPNSLGVPVLVYPPFNDGLGHAYHEAYYGCRQTDKPNFYLFGRVFVPDFWQYPPAAPKATP